MKTISTLKKLFGASLLVAAGFSTSFSQSNAIVASGQPTGVTTEDANYQLSLSENVTKSLEGRYELSIGSSSESVIVTEGRLNELGGIYNVRIPQGTPVTATVYITMAGAPFWHVTVADILGHQDSDPDPDVLMRPLDLNGSASITDTDNNGSGGATAITLPTVVTGEGSSSSLSHKSLPTIDLYPNPATDQISIVTEGEVLWGVTEIIDLTGKKILEIPTGAPAPANGTDRQTVMISQLKPGTYLLRFRTNKDVYTKRFQVVR